MDPGDQSLQPSAQAKIHYKIQLNKVQEIENKRIERKNPSMNLNVVISEFYKRTKKARNKLTSFETSSIIS